MFCKCGSILMPKKENGKVVVKCLKCGHEQKDASFEFREKTAKKDEIIIVDKETETHTVVEAECPKCHNDKAYFWSQQTRASDEPETRFYKCVKCRYTWREYS